MVDDGGDYQVRYQGDLIKVLDALSKEEQDALMAELVKKTEEQKADE